MRQDHIRDINDHDMGKLKQFFERNRTVLTITGGISILYTVLIFLLFLCVTIRQEPMEEWTITNIFLWVISFFIVLIILMINLTPAGLIISKLMNTSKKRRNPLRWIVSIGIVFLEKSVFGFFFILVAFASSGAELSQDPTPGELSRLIWSDCSYLDKVTGIDFPEYTVEDCKYFEYLSGNEVNLTLVFSEPIPLSVYSGDKEDNQSYYYLPVQEEYCPMNKSLILEMNAARDTIYVKEFYD